MKGYICRDCAFALGLSSAFRRRALSATPATYKWRHASTSSSPPPFRIGIIGSGPAGFYSALRILQKCPDAMVDMYEQLPTPFGLVRYGVAPDHPEVKNCQDRFDEVAESRRFNFIGNVTVGDQIPLRTLKPHYDALLFAYGASKDKTLGIPGEHLKGIYSARAFVGWYNGLPEYENLVPDLQAGESAMVIGNGNVALDVARILLSDVDVLRKTDISEQAIEALLKSKIKHVNVVGRRGPMQAAFTIKELRELMDLSSAGFQPLDSNLLPTANWISALPRLEQRKYRFSSLLARGSTTPYNTASRTWALQSLLSPANFVSSKSRPDHVDSVTCALNQFSGYDNRFEANAKTVVTAENVQLDASLVFRSIGYKSTAIKGLTEELGIPFDERTGTIPNDMYGRIITASNSSGSPATTHLPGLYCAGWVKRGPTGVIASTMDDAFASADTILKDWVDKVEFLNGSPATKQSSDSRGWDGVIQHAEVKAANVRHVSWQDWKMIDAEERRRGQLKGKPREKFVTTQDMLKVLD